MTTITGVLHDHPHYTLYFNRLALGVTGSTLFLPQRHSVATASDGSFEIDLPPTDASEIETHYRVTIPTEAGPQIFEFALPSTPSSVALTDLIELDP